MSLKANSKQAHVHYLAKWWILPGNSSSKELLLLNKSEAFHFPSLIYQITLDSLWQKPFLRYSLCLSLQTGLLPKAMQVIPVSSTRQGRDWGGVWLKTSPCCGHRTSTLNQVCVHLDFLPVNADGAGSA